MILVTIIAERTSLSHPRLLRQHRGNHELKSSPAQLEMVETQNQNRTTIRVRYNNPGCLKIVKWERIYAQ
jgi:hypothetical protein